MNRLLIKFSNLKSWHKGGLVLVLIFLSFVAGVKVGQTSIGQSFSNALAIRPLVERISESENQSSEIEKNIVSPSPSTSAKVGESLVKATPNPTITALGTYEYSGFKIKYKMSFPRTGGDVSGNVSESCEGPITGFYNGGDGGEIKGKIDASCGVGFLRQDLKADYIGKVFLNDKRIDLTWEGNVPFYEGEKKITLYFDE